MAAEHARWMAQVMAQAQRYASAWAIAGRGDADSEWTNLAQAAKTELQRLVAQVPEAPAEPAPAPARTADYLVRRMIADPRLAWLAGPGSLLWELATAELARQNNADVEATRAHIEAQLSYTAWPSEEAVQADREARCAHG